MPLLTRSQTKTMDRKAGESLLAYEERLAAFIQEANDRAAAAAKERNQIEQEEEAKRRKEEQDRLRQEEADLQAAAEHRSRQRERLFTRETVIGDETLHWVEMASADGAPETEKGLSALAQVSHYLMATCALQQEEILHLQQTVDQMLARLQALEKQPAAVAAAKPSNLSTRIQVLEDDVSNIKRVHQDFRTSQQATNLQLETQDPYMEKLAAANNCCVVLSSASFTCLINNHPVGYSQSWELPIIVRECFLHGVTGMLDSEEVIDKDASKGDTSQQPSSSLRVDGKSSPGEMHVGASESFSFQQHGESACIDSGMNPRCTKVVSSMSPGSMKVVMVDKPLLQKKLTLRQKNEL
ncbi:hypothetical protein CBR_g58743 [Chara braunii]|uniref:Uncharacterized protein n=1 Tax=Chara braunii TaxID=69332 RepID=A0A388MF23_CHABU|nr:hypothetical protein CBR_g58743 [Chara braunii]|eukprot:GBG93082.1 hypothetical protein CBR_g58743 [Chara braunii]